MMTLETAVERAARGLRNVTDNNAATRLEYAAREAQERIKVLEGALAELLSCAQVPPGTQVYRTERAIEAARQALK